VTQPALIFQGLDDTVVPPALAEEFARRRPNVTLRLLDSDHELLSALEEMWRDTLPFLDNRA
jgi:pimeloyl-ACP methyl ester carboxylesterase